MHLGCGVRLARPGAADRLASPHEEQLDGLAESLGITAPPEVEVVREVEPSEIVAVHAECMTEAGWAVEIVDGVGESAEIAAHQEEAFDLSYYICKAQYPIDERFIRPWTDGQIEVAYEHVTTVWIPCLAQHGVEVQAPSEAVFRQSPQSGWFDSRGFVAQAEAAEAAGQIESLDWLHDECPQWPPDAVLFPQE